MCARKNSVVFAPLPQYYRDHVLTTSLRSSYLPTEIDARQKSRPSGYQHTERASQPPLAGLRAGGRRDAEKQTGSYARYANAVYVCTYTMSVKGGVTKLTNRWRISLTTYHGTALRMDERKSTQARAPGRAGRVERLHRVSLWRPLWSRNDDGGRFTSVSSGKKSGADGQ